MFSIELFIFLIVCQTIYEILLLELRLQLCGINEISKLIAVRNDAFLMIGILRFVAAQSPIVRSDIPCVFINRQYNCIVYKRK